MCFRREAELVRSTMAPSDARAIVRQTCHELDLEELTDTAALLTSELVTNAIKHADGPVHLGVQCRHGELVVSVHDEESQLPRPRVATSAALGGRGLTLVAKLAEHWGCRQVPNDGKAVWFSLRPQAALPTTPSCQCSPETRAVVDLAETDRKLAAGRDKP